MSKQNCVLGFASESWHVEHGSWYDTHIGGTAVLPEELMFSAPPCPLCSAERMLVLQAYSPHSHHHERSVYIYGCNSITCSAEERSWWAVRVCRKNEGDENVSGDSQVESTVAHGERNQAETSGAEQENINWDTDSHASSLSESDLADELELLSLQVELQAARKQATDSDTKNATFSKEGYPRNPQPSKRERHGSMSSSYNAASSSRTTSLPTANLSTFDSFYIAVDHEPPSSPSSNEDASVNALLQEYLAKEKLLARGGSRESWSAENEDGDSATRHAAVFQERISRAPTQVLRYNFGDDPLWPRHPPPPQTHSQCSCGAEMVFELQLLGTCLHFLQPEKAVPPDLNKAGMNFASVAVFTCAADCEAADAIAQSAAFKVSGQIVRVQQDEW